MQIRFDLTTVAGLAIGMALGYLLLHDSNLITWLSHVAGAIA
jgi:hypothetical protein